MATIIPENEFSFKGQAGKKAMEQFPFNDWFDGRIWRIVGGVDYPAAQTAKNFASKCYSVARHLGLKIRISIQETGNFVILQSYIPEDKPDA